MDGYRISAFNGQWIHVAGVWNCAGSAGSADTMRLYVIRRGRRRLAGHERGTTTCANWLRPRQVFCSGSANVGMQC